MEKFYNLLFNLLNLFNNNNIYVGERDISRVVLDKLNV